MVRCGTRTELALPNCSYSPSVFASLVSLPPEGTVDGAHGSSCPMLGFPGGSDGRESTCSAGDLGLIPEFGRSPGGGLGNPLQCSCLENPMDGGTWGAIVHASKKSWT